LAGPRWRSSGPTAADLASKPGRSRILLEASCFQFRGASYLGRAAPGGRPSPSGRALNGQRSASIARPAKTFRGGTGRKSSSGGRSFPGGRWAYLGPAGGAFTALPTPTGASGRVGGLHLGTTRCSMGDSWCPAFPRAGHGVCMRVRAVGAEMAALDRGPASKRARCGTWQISLGGLGGALAPRDRPGPPGPGFTLGTWTEF